MTGARTPHISPDGLGISQLTEMENHQSNSTEDTERVGPAYNHGSPMQIDENDEGDHPRSFTQTRTAEVSTMDLDDKDPQIDNAEGRVQFITTELATHKGGEAVISESLPLAEMTPNGEDAARPSIDKVDGSVSEKEVPEPNCEHFIFKHPTIQEQFRFTPELRAKHYEFDDSTLSWVRRPGIKYPLPRALRIDLGRWLFTHDILYRAGFVEDPLSSKPTYEDRLLSWMKPFGLYKESKDKLARSHFVYYIRATAEAYTERLKTLKGYVPAQASQGRGRQKIVGASWHRDYCYVLEDGWTGKLEEPLLELEQVVKLIASPRWMNIVNRTEWETIRAAADVALATSAAIAAPATSTAASTSAASTSVATTSAASTSAATKSASTQPASTTSAPASQALSTAPAIMAEGPRGLKRSRETTPPKQL